MRRLIALMLVLSAANACAQGYPERPVRVVVPYPPGSTPDLVARTLGERLQKEFGQPFVVENRSGAAGNIGTEVVAKAAPDGYTLLVAVNGPVAVNKHLYANLPFDPDRDLQPVSLLAWAPQMLVVRAGVPAADLRAFLEHLRAQPGRLSYASVGGGSASHLTMELLKTEAGVAIVHVPYRGFPPAVNDLLGGSIDAMFATIPAVLPQVRAGRLRALAVTASKRSDAAPEVPSVAELGYPRLESLAWIGLLAPGGTAGQVVQRLNAATVRTMSTAEV
ncbi:MAG TPA: tripartite tricarboxylate transporter substrate-binding protein, partial [Burkholderiales bacterium]